jgi:hypothetical protein
MRQGEGDCPAFHYRRGERCAQAAMFHKPSR